MGKQCSNHYTLLSKRWLELMIIDVYKFVVAQKDIVKLCRNKKDLEKKKNFLANLRTIYLA